MRSHCSWPGVGVGRASCSRDSGSLDSTAERRSRTQVEYWFGMLQPFITFLASRLPVGGRGSNIRRHNKFLVKVAGVRDKVLCLERNDENDVYFSFCQWYAYPSTNKVHGNEQRQLQIDASVLLKIYRQLTEERAGHRSGKSRVLQPPRS